MITFILVQRAIKIFVIFFLLSAYPVIWFVAQKFVLASDTSIYNFVPQESDVVIEINTRNFLNEAVYQRTFNEDYYNSKVNTDPEVEPPDITQFGIDFFSRIILFRENWSEENIWIAVMAYTNKSNFQHLMEEEVPDSKVSFGDKYALVQLTPSSNQEQLDQHIEKIITEKIKPIGAKIDLDKKFSPENEINCYFSPEGTVTDNQIIEGFLHFDFKKSKIQISGDFTPVSGMDHENGIAYALNEDYAFSMRSSLNIFNSIYWFGKEKISDAPQYSQMAMDYDGMKMFVVNPEFGYEFPFKCFPEFQVHFDLKEPEIWHSFFDTLKVKKAFSVDTTTHQIITAQGAYFQYNITDKVFEIMRHEVSLQPAEEGDRTCFALHMNIDQLIENTNTAVDENHPPDLILQNVLIGGVEMMLEELSIMANIDVVNFKMTHESESLIKADGELIMKEQNGNSIIEGLFFGKGALLFIKDYFTKAETGSESI